MKTQNTCGFKALRNGISSLAPSQRLALKHEQTKFTQSDRAMMRDNPRAFCLIDLHMPMRERIDIPHHLQLFK